MKRTLILSLAAGALALSGTLLGDAPEKKTPAAPAVTESQKPAALSDADLSLFPGSLFEVPDPRGFLWNATSPGRTSVCREPTRSPRRASRTPSQSSCRSR